MSDQFSAAYILGPDGYDGIKEVPWNTPNAITCQHPSCGKSWVEDRTPAGRCPWESDHEEVHGPRIRHVEMTVTFEDGHTAQCLVSEGTDSAWGDANDYLAETLSLREAVRNADIEWSDE